VVCQITCYRSTTTIPLYLSCHAFHSLRDYPRLGHKLEPIFRLMIIILLPYDHRVSPPPNFSNLQLYYIAILQSSMNFPQSSNAARCTSYHTIALRRSSHPYPHLISTHTSLNVVTTGPLHATTPRNSLHFGRCTKRTLVRRLDLFGDGLPPISVPTTPPLISKQNTMDKHKYDGEECFVPLTSAMGIYLDASRLAESYRNEISQDIHSGSWNG
jgi:hypothetical protein